MMTDDQAKRREDLEQEIGHMYASAWQDGVQHLNPKYLRRDKMFTERTMQLFDTYLAAERERIEVEARLDEVALAAHSTADPIKGETWKDWSFRMLEYLEKRKGELQRRKEDDGSDK